MMQRSLRLPRKLWERVEAHARHLSEKDREGLTYTNSDVMRAALEAYLPAEEKPAEKRKR